MLIYSHSDKFSLPKYLKRWKKEQETGYSMKVGDSGDVREGWQSVKNRTT